MPHAARVCRSRRITLKSAVHVFRSKCNGCVYAAAAATDTYGLLCLWWPQTRPMKSRKDYNFGTVFDTFLVKFANKCDSSISYRFQSSKFTDKLLKFSDLLGVTVWLGVTGFLQLCWVLLTEVVNTNWFQESARFFVDLTEETIVHYVKVFPPTNFDTETLQTIYEGMTYC